LEQTFPELAFLESLIETLKDKARIDEIARVQYNGLSFPIYTLCFGSTEPSAPTLCFTGGVHGQEKIGSQVVLSYLESLASLIEWDEVTQNLLQKTRIVFMPIVNPVGMYLIKRYNGNRVDLMRNSPTEAETHNSFPLLGGQRYSPYLPWYRGAKGAPMEIEAQALCDFVRREVLPARVSIALDVHSGYGAMDRIWFPLSKSQKPFPEIAEVFALKNLFDTTFPNHVYRIEPGSLAYTIGGDLWDHLYLEHKASSRSKQVFLPMCLEMGSWLWLKKNPIQIFSSMGLFHPMHLHRHKRILRRHLTLFDFLHKAVLSPEQWTRIDNEDRHALEKSAIDYWWDT
jgi:hypothetical protein